jgi:hypothetical protein
VCTSHEALVKTEASPFVCAPLFAHALKARPAINSARPALPRPPHPGPTFVTMANAPLSERDGGIFKSDLGLSRSRFFLQTGLDRFSRARVFCPSGKSLTGKTARRGAKTARADRQVEFHPWNPKNFERNTSSYFLFADLKVLLAHLIPSKCAFSHRSIFHYEVISGGGDTPASAASAIAGDKCRGSNRKRQRSVIVRV